MIAAILVKVLANLITLLIFGAIAGIVWFCTKWISSSISEQFQLAAEMMTLAQKNRQAACDHKFFTTVILGAKPGEDNAVDECWKCGKREKIKVALINKEQCIEP